MGRPAVVAALAPRLRLVIGRTARRLRQQADEELTPSQDSALTTLVGRGPTTLGALAAEERVRPPTITRIVARLEELGLVERSADRTDRRVARVEPTPAGRRLIERARSRKEAFLARRLAELDPDDLEILERAVGVLERMLEVEVRP